MEKMGGILLQHHQISPNYLAKAAFPGSFALHKGIADVSEEHADGEPKALDLNDMKVAELRELARARRMKGYSRLKKSELIDRLKGV
ncbi:hypothetical protein OsJ_00806 [Oryza sativa Japonica Group]|uniref:Rho termination factor-like N-terminal domain-containing protein n=1 Tax=Oryza sativa subsp. japonica TaxID=39947 RepID=B9ETZ7_ORYSJ|nr:hypothetical protein OsJ_00806 [Oryza sativa Japonica Group]